MNEELCQHLPDGYPVCFSSSCSAAAVCTHAAVRRFIDPTHPSLTAVNPLFSREQEGEQCPCFKRLTQVNYARGFKQTMGSIPKNRVKQVGQEIAALSSLRTYYRQRKGEVLLSPKQQEEIVAVFEKNGVQPPVMFDSYEAGYDW